MFGDLAMHNVAPHLSETPGIIHSCGPDLGQHNTDVYGGLLGLSSENLQDLKDRGVI
jgi:formyl-CoA transferase